MKVKIPETLLFPGLWLLVNLLQAAFTGLFKDESYYYFYATDLAWGYWDHPPLTALLAWAGSQLFAGELGPRLMVILLSTGTALTLQKILQPADNRLFWLLFISFLVFHITGFLSIPDSSLVFFTALFFLAYRDYLESENLQRSVLLGLVMAGMLYSKYLGVMIILLVLLSHIRLLLSPFFWIAVLVTTLAYLPHLFWQYQHGFPSVYYHMLERSHDEYFRWNNFGDYLGGQAALINPLLFIPVIWHLLRFHPENHFDRALKLSALGSLLLPLLLMSRGRVEANWTIAGMVPLFLISFRVFSGSASLRKFLRISAWITLPLLVLVRLALAVDIIPASMSQKVKLESHGWKEFSHRLSEMAGDRPVVFVGSYQNASEYRFYSGQEAFSFNNVLYRNNQYDLSGMEKELQGREVLVLISREDLPDSVIREYGLGVPDSIKFPDGHHQLFLPMQDYRSYNFLSLAATPTAWSGKAGSRLKIPLLLENPLADPIDFSARPGSRTTLSYTLLQYGDPVLQGDFEDISNLVLGKDYQTTLLLTLPETPGTYYLRVSIRTGWLPPGINGRIHRLTVTP